MNPQLGFGLCVFLFCASCGERPVRMKNANSSADSITAALHKRYGPLETKFYYFDGQQIFGAFGIGDSDEVLLVVSPQLPHGSQPIQTIWNGSRIRRFDERQIVRVEDEEGWENEIGLKLSLQTADALEIRIVLTGGVEQEYVYELKVEKASGSDVLLSSYSKKLRADRSSAPAED